MNYYLVFIVAVLLLSYILHTFVNHLNLKGLKPDLPGEFEGIYDAEKYKKSQMYTKEITKFSIISTTTSLVITIAFIFIGGFNWFDLLARSFGLNSVFTGLIFMALLAVGSSLIELPFSIYSTFVLEEKYGFNKTSVKTFILDLVKGLILGAVLGALVLGLILLAFEKIGPNAWIFAWIGVTVFVLFVQLIAPVWIMPLFNRFTPLEDGSLRNSIEAYVQKEGFKLSGIFTMDGSKRSTKLNAYFTGFGKYRRIVFFDTLVEKLSEEEIVGVLAHEMGHFKLKHILSMTISSILQNGLMLFILSLFMGNRGLFDAFQMENVSIYAGIVFFMFLYTPISMFFSIIANIFSRRHEYQADAYSAGSTGKAEALISGLKKLSVENLSNLTPHPWFVFVNYSHPPVLMRIKALKNI